MPDYSRILFAHAPVVLHQQTALHKSGPLTSPQPTSISALLPSLPASQSPSYGSSLLFPTRSPGDTRNCQRHITHISGPVEWLGTIGVHHSLFLGILAIHFRHCRVMNHAGVHLHLLHPLEVQPTPRRRRRGLSELF
ncbi:hypothetical protein RvY_12126-1 [Ramazzottius varieornatus]|uniref:Uncharacterized protein n=1 Tax=Ramazzottius varieornatus TaxID=947166 RepID=A0A1D1VNV5_RAMVA|nr:hypothetical protein RvY_12126-1 [Ramazzottius varieornatus]